MKPLFVILLCLCTALAHAQAVGSSGLPIDPETKLITYSEVVQAPGASQAELYARAKLWFVTAFKSSKDVVQADEKDAGIVQGTGWREIQMPVGTSTVPLKLWYTIKIAVKQGRYKYDISGFQTQFFPESYNLTPDKYTVESVLNNPKATAEAQANYGKQADTAGKDIATGIKAGMIKPAAGTTAGKDW